MLRDDPFAGIHLSEQANPGKIEQRLFEPNGPPPTATTRRAAAKLPSSPASEPPAPKVPKPTPWREPSELKPVELSRSRFELAEVPLFKASYLFTQEELEALEDLKIALRRELDAKVTKNDLVRLALHLLLDDRRANGSRSYAVRKVRKG